jgi:nucleoside-diphosphate-sugar epimerase/quercetin dioxygenase-like cupin family protein/2-polyprenyl-3-methyl-5-hydroxy-6-metoxy-1,4-benzoquinol methylase
MKKEKIVITGGLGYIGFELCKLYSGEAWFKDITVVDNSFYAERIRQIRNWGINFVQTDLFDKAKLSTILKDADLIIHLAGITNVAYTKTESNQLLDEEIYKVGVLGTRNILEYVPQSAKIIFPSTHVIFEGFEQTTLEIREDEDPKPILTYSKGKTQSEEDIIKSGKNYIILRLASVYGYSGDSTRIKIMPNLFASLASQGGTIKLFSGGVQLKSLVSIFDVARCFKFMCEQTNITNEIFHCSKESMTVKEVAVICKKYAPQLNLVETDDEIPNLGYTISNVKLLSAGFEFMYNIEDSIAEMIMFWSQPEKTNELEYIINSHDHYRDERGEIGNYELTEPINLIGQITSKKGTVRANHYHPIQEQKCLLIKGQYISVIKDLSKKNSHIETKIINAGDLSVIKPNVAHTMVFTEDSIFLNLVRGNRDHDKFGITHTIPFKLVDSVMSKRLRESVITRCRSCSSRKLNRVISLGESPLANNLLNTSEQEFSKYPLEMDYCEECHNCQLSVIVDPREMFDNYLYVSSTSKDFVQHFENAALKYKENFNLNDSSVLVDIGSNDGVALKPMKELGIKTIGVEPAKNLAKSANAEGLYTINSYFNEHVTSRIQNEFGKVDIITASNVFAHSDKLQEISNNVFNILKKDGAFIIEVQYLVDTISTLTFDNIYHEHVNFWTVTSLNNFFKRLGYFVNKVEHIETHGGSIRVYVQSFSAPDSSVEEYVNSEKKMGVDTIRFYKEFSAKVELIRQNVRINFDLLKKKYSLIAGYAAPAKATTALNYFGLDSSDIKFIIEDNKLKHDKFIPGVGIPIKSKSFCKSNMPDLIIVLAWNFFDSIVKQNDSLIKSGVKFMNITDLYDSQ